MQKHLTRCLHLIFKLDASSLRCVLTCLSLWVCLCVCCELVLENASAFTQFTLSICLRPNAALVSPACHQAIIRQLKNRFTATSSECIDTQRACRHASNDHDGGRSGPFPRVRVRWRIDSTLVVSIQTPMRYRVSKKERLAHGAPDARDCLSSLAAWLQRCCVWSVLVETRPCGQSTCSATSRISRW